MATCRDCVSYDVCENNKKIKIEIYDNGFLKQPHLCEYVQQICKTFKNKADFVEVKHGEWIVEKDSTSVTYRCPVCKFELTLADPEEKLEYKGCPMCFSILKEGAE